MTLSKEYSDFLLVAPTKVAVVMVARPVVLAQGLRGGVEAAHRVPPRIRAGLKGADRRA
jgi:hypothetical protein